MHEKFISKQLKSAYDTVSGRDYTKSKIAELLACDLLFGNDCMQSVHTPDDLQCITVLIVLLSGLAQTSA
ncbi:hypothetical protein BTVI_01954 [Pitangus sulphuratus]|nr:hypothetical protein BTVI_58632 [Pitangus sulphuratus]KAJ7426671.1 hypothetical protein BTVI_01954 [Pitangus sulphuratus]